MKATTITISTEDLKKYALLFLGRIRELQKEVMLYRGVVELLKQQDSELIDRLVLRVSERPELEQCLDELDRKAKEAIFASIEEGFAEGALAQFLRGWKAEGPTN